GFRWGLRYALEGSRLGGAMLSRQVAPGLPRAYLSAIHEKGGWAAFQARLDAAAGPEQAWIDDAVRGATAAFALFQAAGEVERPTVHG
ncbi:MAG: heme oxygenase, partial [Sphingobium sp.]